MDLMPGIVKRTISFRHFAGAGVSLCEHLVCVELDPGTDGNVVYVRAPLDDERGSLQKGDVVVLNDDNLIVGKGYAVDGAPLRRSE